MSVAVVERSLGREVRVYAAGMMYASGAVTMV